MCDQADPRCRPGIGDSHGSRASAPDPKRLGTCALPVATLPALPRGGPVPGIGADHYGRTVAPSRGMCDASSPAIGREAAGRGRIRCAAARLFFTRTARRPGQLAPLYNLLSDRRDGGSSRGGLITFVGGSFYVELKPIFPGFNRAGRSRSAVSTSSDSSARERRAAGGDDAPDGFRSPREPPTKRQARLRGTQRGVRLGLHRLLLRALRHGESRSVTRGSTLKSLAMGRLGISWTETSKENLEKLARPCRPQDPAHRFTEPTTTRTTRR